MAFSDSMEGWDHNRSVVSARIALDHGDDLGIVRDKLLKGTGLASEQLENDLLEVTAAQEMRVFANLLAVTGNPIALGVSLGRRYRLSSYGIWGYGLVCSATFGEAVDRALRYLRLTYAFTGIARRTARGKDTLRFTGPAIDLDLRHLLVVRDMAAGFTLHQELAGRDFTLENLSLSAARQASAATDEVVAAHFGRSARFGSTHDEYTFDESWSKRKLPLANSVTVAYCDEQCRRLVEKHGEASTAAIIEKILEKRAWRPLSLDEASDIVGLSSRTLKRRLNQEGQSFSDIVARARHIAAKAMISDGMAVSAVAECLGFADASSFSQSFKRSEGISPMAARKL